MFKISYDSGTLGWGRRKTHPQRWGMILLKYCWIEIIKNIRDVFRYSGSLHAPFSIYHESLKHFRNHMCVSRVSEARCPCWQTHTGCQNVNSIKNSVGGSRRAGSGGKSTCCRSPVTWVCIPRTCVEVRGSNACTCNNPCVETLRWRLVNPREAPGPSPSLHSGEESLPQTIWKGKDWLSVTQSSFY